MTPERRERIGNETQKMIEISSKKIQKKIEKKGKVRKKNAKCFLSMRTNWRKLQNRICTSINLSASIFLKCWLYISHYIPINFSHVLPSKNSEFCCFPPARQTRSPGHSSQVVPELLTHGFDTKSPMDSIRISGDSIRKFWKILANAWLIMVNLGFNRNFWNSGDFLLLFLL